jgi:hypothetical protein
MNAGSYVIRPEVVCAGLDLAQVHRAESVPSWIGKSYFFPVRLSVIVSVSAI